VTHLILTTEHSGAGHLMQTGIADIVIPLDFRFVGGPVPSAADLATILSTRSANHGPALPHWLDDTGWRNEEISRQGLGLIELCQRCETVELWIDPEPNAQLILIQLLDHFRAQGKVASTLILRQADIAIGVKRPETLPEWRPPAVKIVDHHLEIGSMAWQAYCHATPEAWIDLLGRDISVLPQLPQTVLELLEELPLAATGLGMTEMQMLGLIAEGNAGPYDVFPGHNKRNQRRVFGYWEIGLLLDGLARRPAPAVSGLDEGPFTLEMHDAAERHRRYKGSKLQLTELGKAVLAGTEDFSRHNPIHRWWGGTELTSDHLWRWDPANRALIAP
jgi:hypothetical protein